MADQLINLKILDAKVAIALEGFLKIYPNEEMTEDDSPVAKYTDKQWVAEKTRRNTARDIRRGLQMIANEKATVVEDNDIVKTV